MSNNFPISDFKSPNMKAMGGEKNNFYFQTNIYNSTNIFSMDQNEQKFVNSNQNPAQVFNYYDGQQSMNYENNPEIFYQNNKNMNLRAPNQKMIGSMQKSYQGTNMEKGKFDSYYNKRNKNKNNNGFDKKNKFIEGKSVPKKKYYFK